MSDSDLLKALLDEERRLVFPYFDHATAWDLGGAMREAAHAAQYPVAILIRRSGQRLFHTALSGSSPDNDAWLERKSAVVDRFGHSSYYIGCKARAESDVDFNVASRLDPERFAAHGGAFPLLVAKSGCIGTIAVSGLPQREDHRFVVEQIQLFLDHFDGRTS
ncbi:MAG: heme-degrading domain-containing protein [Acidimicrobiales bacterium]